MPGMFKYLRRTNIAKVVIGHFLSQGTDYYGKNVTLLLSADDAGTMWRDTSFANSSINASAVAQRGNGPFTTDLGPATSVGAAVFSGAGYIDVSDSNANLGIGDFTIDMWVSSANAPGTRTLLWLNSATSDSSYCALNLVITDGQLGINCSYEGTAWDVSNLSLGAITANGWTYIAVQRTNGVLSVYSAGTKLADLQLPRDLMTGTIEYIGAGSSAARNYFVGSLTDVRITKGTARYSGATMLLPTVPSGVEFNTSPDTYASSVALLLNFNDIYGKTTFVDECGAVAYPVASDTLHSYPVLTSNNAKFDGSSGLFAGNYIYFNAEARYGLPGDFTFETFVNFSTLGGSFSHPLLTIGSHTNGLCIRAGYTNNNVSVYINNAEKGGVLAGGFTFQTGQWYHIAVVRTGATLEVYVDGKRRLKNTAASGNIYSAPAYIGYNTGSGEYAQCTMDNLRLTKGVARYTANFTVPTTALTSITNTTLLLSGTNLTDSSSLTQPVCTTTLAKISPFNDGTWSSYFNGLTEYQLVASSINLAYGTGDFTIECWIYPDNPTAWTTGNNYIFDHGSNVGYLHYNLDKIEFVGTSTHTSVAASLIPANVWTHVAVVRQTGNLKIYINGVSVALTATASTWNQTTAVSLNIGRYGGNTVFFPGGISNLRIVKGTAVYTADFTVMTTRPTAITNTVLLTCRNSTLVDNSASPLTITAPASIAPTLSGTTPIAGGGSLAFNGTTTKLIVPTTTSLLLGTSDFSIEFWMYPTVVGVQKGLIGNHYNSSQTQSTWNIYTMTTNKIRFASWSTTFVESTSTIAINTWYHVSVQRRGGVVSLFVNGVMEASATCTSDFNFQNSLHLGWNPQSTFFTGNISNLRIVKGSTAYNTDIALPTAAYNVVAAAASTTDPYLCNVSLLLDGESVAEDAFGATTLSVPFGSVTLSSSVKKFGSSSIAFANGSLFANGSIGYQLGALDFTVECFVYTTSSADKQIIFDMGGSLSMTNSMLAIYRGGGADGVNTNGFGWLSDGTVKVTSGVTVENGQWYHVAVAKDSGTLRIFIDGTIRYSGLDTTDYDQGLSTLCFGSSVDGSTGQFVGNIDSFRLTKSYCRYKSNFVVPTAAFDTGSTVVDPHSASVALNLKCEASNGGSLTFTDSSVSALVPTYTAGPLTSQNVSPFSPATWSASFGATNTTTIYIAGNNILNFGVSNWTVEGWVKLNAMPTSDTWSGNTKVLIGVGTQSTADGFCCAIGTTKLMIQNQDTGRVSSITHGMVINTWYHLAYVRQGDMIHFFVGGAYKGTVYFPDAVAQGAHTWIGSETGQLAYINGFISNLRVVKGTAVYQTVVSSAPTAPLATVANTKVLIVDSLTTDYSSTPQAITKIGTPTVTAVSPYAGGGSSILFNGTTDALTLPYLANVGAGDFTLEGMFYFNAFYNGMFVYAGNGTGAVPKIYLQINSAGILAAAANATNTVDITAQYALSTATWYHIALVRNGSILTLYVNGNIYGTAPTAINLTTITGVFKVGYTSTDGSKQYHNGYIADLRMVTGSAVYTTVAGFTPATSQLTAVAGTSLLCLQDKGFSDNSTNKWPLICNGAMYITSAAYSSRATSLYCPPGVASYLSYPANTAAFNFGTAPFTIEGWFCAVPGNYNNIIINKNNTAVGGFQLYRSTNSNWYWVQQGTSIQLGGSCSQNTWMHFALVRSDTTLMFFLNGKRVYANTNNYNYTNSADITYIGKDNVTSYLNGWLSDFRVTKGVARYTSDFALPVSRNSRNPPRQGLVTTHYVEDPYTTLNWVDPVYGVSTGTKLIASTSASVPLNQSANIITSETGNMVSLGYGIGFASANKPYYIQEITSHMKGGQALPGENAVGFAGPAYMPEGFTVTGVLNNPTKVTVSGFPTLIAYVTSGRTVYWSTIPGLSTSDYRMYSVGSVVNGTIITGLLPSTTYYFSCVNNQYAGDSARSSEIAYTTPAAVTSVIDGGPGNIAFSIPDAYTWVFTWTPTTGATGYMIYGARNSLVGGVNASNAEFSYYVDGGQLGTFSWLVDPNTELTTTHYFSIAVVNSFGTGSACAQFSRAHIAKATAGTLSSSQKGPFQCKLTWTNPGGSVSGYKILGSNTSGFTEANYEYGWDIAGAANNSLVVPFDSQGQTRYYRLAYYYNNNSGTYSTLGTQFTLASIAEVATLNSVTADAVLPKIVCNITSSWDTTNDYYLDVYTDAALTSRAGYQYFKVVTPGAAQNITIDRQTVGIYPGRTYYVILSVTHSNNVTTNTAYRSVVTGWQTPPSSLAAPDIRTTMAKLTWTNPTLTGVTNVNYYLIGCSSAANATALNADWYAQWLPEVKDLNGRMARGNAYLSELTSWWITGLTPNTTYYFRILCQRWDTYGNAFGADNWVTACFSNTLTLTTKANPGGLEPTLLTAVRGTSGAAAQTTVTLTWQAVAGATSYQIVRSNRPVWGEDGQWWWSGPGMPNVSLYSPGNTTTAVITNCVPGETNFFKVYAYVGATWYDHGNVLSVDMAADTAMPTPSSSAAADAHNSRIINWSAWTSAGTGAATGYRILCKKQSAGALTERIPGNNTIGWQNTPWATAGAVTTLTISGLETNTAYYFAVQPFTALGFGPMSAVASFTTGFAVAPTTTSFTTVANGNGTIGSAKLIWPAYANALGYQVRIKESNSWSDADPITGGELAATTVQYQWDNLKSGRTYYVQVRARIIVSGSTNIGYAEVTHWSAWSTALSVTLPAALELYKGNATVSTTRKKFGTGSIRLNGGSTSNGLIVHPHESLNNGGGLWTIEGWFYFDSVATEQEMAVRCDATSTNVLWRLYLTAGGIVKFAASMNGGSLVLDSVVGTITAGTWNHVAVVCTATNYTYVPYINGVAGTSFGYQNGIGVLSKAPLFLGASPRNTNAMVGNIDDFRMTIGVARYTANFTPAELPELPVQDSYWRGVSLLLHCKGAHGSTTIVDHGFTGHTCTANNGAVITEFKNIVDNRVLSLASSNSSVSIPSSTKFAFGTGDYTIEAWVYLTSSGTEFSLFTTDSFTPNFRFCLSQTGVPRVYNTDGTVSTDMGSTTVPQNAWTHVCFMRNSAIAAGAADGSTCVFINGIQVGAAYLTYNYLNNKTVRVGATDTVQSATGYIDELRVTKGVARYPASGFIPTSLELPDAQDPKVDAYWSNVVVLIKGNPIDGQPIPYDSSKHHLVSHTSVTASLPLYNTKTAIRVSFPEYALAQNYAIYVSTDPAFVVAMNLASNVTRTVVNYFTHDIAGLIAGTTYYVKVAPICDGLEGQCINQVPVQITTATIPQMTVPTIVAGRAPKTMMRVSWDYYTEGAEVYNYHTYNIYYSLTADVGNGVIGTSLTTSIANVKDIAGLTSGTTYYVRVSAVTKWGESPLSSVASWTTA